MGHVILQRMVDDAGLSDDVRVSSSGTGDWHVGEHAAPRTVEVLARHGYDGSRHRAREFDPDEFDEFDLILASDEGHVRTLNRLARAPHHRGKIRLVREFDPDAVAAVHGDRQWTWCFRAGLYTLFKIDPTRSADVLIEVLGAEFNGVLGCDYFSAYRRYLREFDVSLQFCLAHLIRDVKFLTTLPDARDRMYGTRLREALRELFGVIHRRELLTAERFQTQLEAARAKVLRCGTHNVPATNHCRNLAKRFEEHGENYFRFITTPGVEPTNNLAEQAIRFVVIDRLITQGTRSEKGNRWCERIWTVIATCTQQGRSVFEYLEAAVGAWFAGTEPPFLLPGV